MKRILATLGAALAVLLLAGGNVRADGIPWAYSAASTTIYSNNIPLPTSQVNFTGSGGVATGNSGIIIYNLTTTSNPFNGGVDSFTNVPFNLAVTLTDANSTSSHLPASVSAGTVNFAGLFNASNVTARSLLPAAIPYTWTSPTSVNVVLGASDSITGWNNYNVQVVSFTPPGQPGGAPGSIEAVVTITPASGPGGSGETETSATPEPASLVLASLGLPLVILLRRRMKKVQGEAILA